MPQRGMVPYPGGLGFILVCCDVMKMPGIEVFA